MMEIKTSYVDLIDRQMSGTQKKESKTEEGISGFKNLLKDKNQKKNTGSGDPGTEAQTAAAETVVPYMNGTAQETQTEEVSFSIPGQELFQTQTENASSVGAVPVNNDSANLLGTISPIQLLKSLSIKNQADGEEDTAFSGKGFTDYLTGKSDKASNASMLNGLDLQPTNNPADVAEVLNQGKAEDTSMKLTAISDDSLTNSALAETGKNAEALTAVKNSKVSGKEGSDKEEKVSENALGSIQEKSFEPTHVIHTKEDKAVTVTVNESNPEEMEAKLSEQILSQIRTGKNSMELQLEPHNLGKILLKVSYEENQVNVSIVCSESKTLKLLSHSAAEIGSILEANVERPFQVVVDKQEADYLQNQQQNQQNGGREQHQQHQQKQTDDNAEDFIQKLRLGFFGADSGLYSEVSD